MYAFGYNQKNDRWEVESRTFKAVKQRLLFQLTNSGNPIVRVTDANLGNRGELLLDHDHQGVDLRQDYAEAVLKSLARVWKRPVELRTLVEGKPNALRHDGKEYTARTL
jgi:stage V sporulation protein R